MTDMTNENEMVSTETPVENNEKSDVVTSVPADRPVSNKTMLDVVKQTKEVVGMMESLWLQLREEFGINETHMKRLIEFNNENRDPKLEPKEGTEEPEYDEFNGLDKITPEKVVEIFGADSDVIGVEHGVTITNIKSAASTFFSLYEIHTEYARVEKEFAEYMEDQEKYSIEELRRRTMDDSDPVAQEAAASALRTYESNRYLEYLVTDTDEKLITYLTSAFTNQGKIKYMLEKAKGNLVSLSVPEKFILEISSYEKRFLDSEYHCQNNLMLLYFLNMMAFGGVNADSVMRARALGFVITMDKMIRRMFDEEEQSRVMKNIIAFQDLFTALIDKPMKDPE